MSAHALQCHCDVCLNGESVKPMPPIPLRNRPQENAILEVRAAHREVERLEAELSYYLARAAHFQKKLTAARERSLAAQKKAAGHFAPGWTRPGGGLSTPKVKP
jgi:hypothetical protein